ncbi:MAG: hypothetical protein JWO83_1554 [Caulobacteraceae bacterium]|nr:hypothetical protein [Caulobacteraceae bacterium]
MTAPHDVPSAPEMLAAVRQWMTTVLMENLDGQLKFHARVAANMIGMVEREFELGADLAENHRRRLQALGVASERELAAAIRSGAIDYRGADLQASILDTVVAKLRVANPRYLAVEDTIQS